MPLGGDKRDVHWTGQGFSMVQPIGDQAQCQRLHSRRGLVSGATVGRHSRQRRYVGQPSTVILAEVLDCEGEALAWESLHHRPIIAQTLNELSDEAHLLGRENLSLHRATGTCQALSESLPVADGREPPLHSPNSAFVWFKLASRSSRSRCAACERSTFGISNGLPLSTKSVKRWKFHAGTSL